MGINLVNKTISTNEIACDGTMEVTLTLTASPDIVSNPTDIVLVLDRSGSMAGTPIENLKSGADKFIDIIAEATGGAAMGEIGSGSRMAIVSFSDVATQDTPLTTSVSQLKNAVSDLTAGGSTNHADAFTKAIELFDPLSANAKVIVMFTDGETTAGPDPDVVAAAARASGIIIYCIGLVGRDGVDEATLDNWATPPSASHVLIAPTDQDLEQAFETLAQNISKPGATNIVIEETVNPDFKILSVLLAEEGTVVKESDTTLKWSIPQLGVTANQSAALKFVVEHITDTTGIKKVNASVVYSDLEQNHVVFPDPVVTVDCGAVVFPEDCPKPINIAMDGCEDTVYYNMEDTVLESVGRILQLDVKLKDICPRKRVALCITLNELDEHGNEYKRGIKFITVPAHYYEHCKDVEVRCIRFILPEDLSTLENTTSLCGQRQLVARAMAHYVDYDFECCKNHITIS